MFIVNRMTAALVAALAILLIAPAAAQAAVATPWITQKGAQFVDSRTGKPVILRGVNMSWACHNASKIPQLWPGVNFVRLSVPWAPFETSKNVFVQSAFDRLNRCIQTLQDEHLNVLIENHEVYWSSYFPGGSLGIPVKYYADGRFPQTIQGMVAAQLAFFRKNGERARSQSWFDPFVARLTQDISKYPAVMGEEIWNEPKGLDTQRATQVALCWQAAPLRVIRNVDPSLSVAFMARDGGDLGVEHAKLNSCFIGKKSDWKHIFLDLHFYLTGLGYVYNAAGTAWNPSWWTTHNQNYTNYHGTVQNQWANLEMPFSRTQGWGIPLLVGEFGARNDDVGASKYYCQVIPMFQKHGISWAAFTMDRNVKFQLVNQQGQFEPRVNDIRSGLSGC